MSVAGAIVLPKSGETYGQQEALAGTAIHQFKEFLSGNDDEAYFDIDNAPDGNIFAQSVAEGDNANATANAAVNAAANEDGIDEDVTDEDASNEAAVDEDIIDENIVDDEAANEESTDETEVDQQGESSDSQDEKVEDSSENQIDSEDEDKDKDEKDEQPWLNPQWTLVDESYFDDALFIGDSREQGFGMYSQLENITVYANKGFQIYTAATKPIVETENGKITIAEALDQRRGEFKKVYIMFGLNEIGWGTDEQVDLYFYNLIDYIKETQPDATIFLQSIIHVSQKVENSSSLYTNEVIDKRNEHLKEIAKNEHIYYLDLNEIFTDENNCLFADAASDGIHLKSQYILVWKEYLMAHGIVEKEN